MPRRRSRRGVLMYLLTLLVPFGLGCEPVEELPPEEEEVRQVEAGFHCGNGDEAPAPAPFARQPDVTLRVAPEAELALKAPSSAAPIPPPVPEEIRKKQAAYLEATAALEAEHAGDPAAYEQARSALKQQIFKEKQ